MAEKVYSDMSMWPDAQAMLEKADREGISTAWDRYEDQTPHCNFCEQGTTCTNCTMGPCRILPSDKDRKQYGVCGADADVIVARNFGRFVAGGSAGHSDHGRDLVETLEAIVQGKAPGYEIRDPEKLVRIAAELGVETEGRELLDVANDLLDECYADFGSRRHEGLKFLSRVPEKRMEVWRGLGIVPRGIDREIAEMMHRTHMGCDNDHVSLLLHSARTSLSDGWGGSMIGTELSDIVFGTPSPTQSTVNLGVMKETHVNVLVHGHNPVVSEMILAAAREPEMVKLATDAGAEGINIAGLCCTGNELLMRQGIPIAGNHLMSELAIVTGAADAVVVDYQCIMPSMVRIAECYQTEFITTSHKARFTGATHVEVHPHNAQEQAREIIRLAVEAYKRRDPEKIDIPVDPVPLTTGFSNEAILAALGGTPEPLLDAIKSGAIKGVVAMVGCNNPRYKHDSLNVGLMKELIARDILVLVTGCVTTAAGKAGLLMPEGKEQAGEGLKAVCEALGTPPVLHMGSCVDNARILQLVALLANELGVDISDLPVAASSPEWYSEKAAAIGLYAVVSGIPTHLGHPPHITGSANVTEIATSTLNDLVGAAFIIEPDVVLAADKIEASINERRAKLGI